MWLTNKRGGRKEKKKNRRFIDKTALGRSESSVWVGCTLNYKVKCFQVLPNTPAGGCWIKAGKVEQRDPSSIPLLLRT